MLKKSLALSALLHLIVIIAIVFRMNQTPPVLKTKPVVVTMVAIPQPPQVPQKVTPPKAPPPKEVMPQKVPTPAPKVVPVMAKSALVKSPTLPVPVETPVARPIEPTPPAPVEKPVSKPVETPAAPAPQKPSQVDTSSIKNQYLGYLIENIRSHKTYPNKAKRLGQSGTVEIAFTVMADGTITNVRVKQSSNFELLDKAAADIFTLLAKVRPIPKELGKESWDFSLPINYQLN